LTKSNILDILRKTPEESLDIRHLLLIGCGKSRNSGKNGAETAGRRRNSNNEAMTPG